MLISVKFDKQNRTKIFWGFQVKISKNPNLTDCLRMFSTGKKNFTPKTITRTENFSGDWLLLLQSLVKKELQQI